MYGVRQNNLFFILHSRDLEKKKNMLVEGKYLTKYLPYCELPRPQASLQFLLALTSLAVPDFCRPRISWREKCKKKMELTVYFLKGLYEGNKDNIG